MKRALLLLAATGLMVCAAVADWDPGDPYKMHYPQLPDPTGWDVNGTYPKVLADDWMCTETGPVSDVHFWGSWRSDLVGQISRIHLSIHANVPDPGFSHPGELLWQHDFFPGEWTERIYGTGAQGWYNPNTGEFVHPDHTTFFQYNIEDIPDPFVQEQDQIYWLDISVVVEDPLNTMWGWKTSLDHWEDDAVWSDIGGDWTPLVDPLTGASLDMAFVITPEPASFGLLLLGAWMLRRR